MVPLPLAIVIVTVTMVHDSMSVPALCNSLVSPIADATSATLTPTQDAATIDDRLPGGVKVALDMLKLSLSSGTRAGDGSGKPSKGTSYTPTHPHHSSLDLFVPNALTYTHTLSHTLS